MTEAQLRRKIATDIRIWSAQAYEGAMKTDDPYVLIQATFMKTAMEIAADIAEGLEK